MARLTQREFERLTGAPAKAKKPAVPQASEAEIQASILDYLQKRGIEAYRTNAGGAKLASGGFIRLLPPGWSDITGVLPGGRALFIECKTTRNKPTADQAAFLARMTALGALAFVARSVADVEAALVEYGV